MWNISSEVAHTKQPRQIRPKIGHFFTFFVQFRPGVGRVLVKEHIGKLIYTHMSLKMPQKDN